METYYPLKRKGFEVSDNDFSEFPVFSPARKIRRLDAELAPIVEEDEAVVVEPSPVPEFYEKSGGLKLEELPENDERAIVLFNPVKNAPLVRSPESFSISVDPNLVSGFKYQLPWSNQPSSWRVDGDETKQEDNNTSGSSNGCMAVVPWVPSQLLSPPQDVPPSQLDNPDSMEVEDMEGVEMDVEESMNVEQGNVNVNGSAVGFSEGLHQWQQHCMIHQLPQNMMSTPVVWYR